jgi:hypothetical protein
MLRSPAAQPDAIRNPNPVVSITSQVQPRQRIHTILDPPLALAVAHAILRHSPRPALHLD